MNIKKLIVLPIILATASLAGCASQHPKIVDLNLKYMTTHSAPLRSTDRNAQSQVAEASTAVGHSLSQLAAIQMATHPHAKLPTPLNPKVLGMTQPASLNWNGPAAPVLKSIAHASHYTFRILGQKPAIPPMVIINTPNQVPLATILRNVAWQIRKQAEVRVYPGSKIIELRYFS